MRHLLVVLGLLLAAAPASAAAATRLPAGWPDHLTLGLRSGTQDGAALRTQVPVGVRYLYLSGGVRAGRAWQDWAHGDGTYVPQFIEDAAANRQHPVFSYYMLLQSEPAASAGGDEASRFLRNLRDGRTMRAYLADLRTFFARAGATGRPATIHVEPDLWGYVQTRSRGDDARTVRAVVPGRAPDTVAGLAQEIVRLRDRHAPNVSLAYHLSVWGTGHDPSRSDPADAAVDGLAARAARFQRSLGARFDLVFFEFADRDSGYRVKVGGDSRDAWWDAGDFRRHGRFIAGVLRDLQKPGVLWQIPLGTTLLPNVHGRYQDNRVQWLLDGEASRDRLRVYRDAGIVGLLFGHALDGNTCACDQLGDGGDDDGGFLKQAARAYYAAGPLPVLARRVGRPARSRPATAPRGRWRSRARLSRSGRTVTVTAYVTSSVGRRALLSVELHRRGGARVAQQAFDKRRLRAGRPVRVRATFTLPPGFRGRPVVRVGAFEPGWGRMLHWNAAAG